MAATEALVVLFVAGTVITIDEMDEVEDSDNSFSRSFEVVLLMWIGVGVLLELLSGLRLGVIMVAAPTAAGEFEDADDDDNDDDKEVLLLESFLRLLAGLRVAAVFFGVGDEVTPPTDDVEEAAAAFVLFGCFFFGRYL